MIRLEHERHGVKFALLEAEAIQDEKAGWVRVDQPKREQVNAVRKEETSEASEEVKPRRGRPRKGQ
jgi:hypothetical protein